MTSPKSEKSAIDEILELIGAVDIPKEARPHWAAVQAMKDWPCLLPIQVQEDRGGELPKEIQQPQKGLSEKQRLDLIDRAMLEVDPKLMQEVAKSENKQAPRPPGAIMYKPGKYIIEPEVAVRFGHT